MLPTTAGLTISSMCLVDALPAEQGLRGSLLQRPDHRRKERGYQVPERGLPVRYSGKPWRAGDHSHVERNGARGFMTGVKELASCLC